jgi:hypothetical protein
MWDRLKPTDIEQARQELQRRRADTLARHAREVEELQAAQAQIETLHGLIDAFARKFKTPTELPDGTAVEPAPPGATSAAPASSTSSEPAVASSDQIAPDDPDIAPDAVLPAVADAATAAPPRRGPPPAQGEYPRTNFEAFSRAISKASF